MNNLQCIIPSLYIITGAVCAWIGMFLRYRIKDRKERKYKLEMKFDDLENRTNILKYSLENRTDRLGREITEIKNKFLKHLAENNKETNNE